MRPLRWADRQARIWWPAAAALVGGLVLATLGWFVSTVVDDRAQLREQRDLLAEQSEQLAVVIERNRRADAESGEQLREAISEIEGLLIDHFASHDANVAWKLNDTLHRIEVLLGRPAGTLPEPVAAKPAPISPAPRHEPTVRPAPSTTQAPRPGGATAAPAAPTPAPAPTAPAPTTPDQRRCPDQPDHPRC